MASNLRFLLVSPQRVSDSVGLIISDKCFTSALKALSSSAPRAPSAHTDSARKVRLQSNQRQLLREVEAMVSGRRGRSAGVRRGSVSTVWCDVFDEFLPAVLLV